MVNSEENWLISAKLLSSPQGLTGNIEVAEKVDKRMLLMLCDNLIEALERSGYITEYIAQARPLIKSQLAEWGFAQTGIDGKPT